MLESRRLFSITGTMDSTFGQQGFARNPFDMTVVDIAVQADNKIVLVGTHGNQWAIGRVNPNGSADLSFGDAHTGLITANWGPRGTSYADAVAIQNDGRIVVGGSVRLSGNQSQIEIARLLPDGAFDSSFAGGAGAESLLGSQITDGISDLAIQPDGKIVFGADHCGPGLFDEFDILVGRLNSSGSWDTTFGDARTNGRAGYARLDFGDGERDPLIALQPNGRIVVASESGHFTSDTRPVVAARLYTTGQLDPTFDHDGKVVVSTIVSQFVDALTVEPNGGIVVAGSSEGTDGIDHLGIMRFEPNGQVDQVHFDTRIKPDERSSSATAVFDTQSGKFLVVGSVNSGGTSSQTFAAMYNDNGTRDTTWGNNGLVVHENHAEGASSAAMAPGGLIVAAGFSTMLERFNSSDVLVSISPLETTVNEGAVGFVKFSRNTNFNFDTTVAFTTSGTASGILDYTGTLVGPTMIRSIGRRITLVPTGGVAYVTIPAGSSAVFVPLTTVDDALAEPDETVIVTGQGNNNTYFFNTHVVGNKQTGIQLVQDNKATITIKDNDTAAAKPLTRAIAPPAGPWSSDSAALFSDEPIDELVS